MKVYEKMGIDLTTPDGFSKAYELNCLAIPNKPNNCFGKRCGECLAERLFAEAPTKKVKRWKTYDGDFEKALKDFYNTHISVYSRISDYNTWLMEEIEVEIEIV